MAASLEGVWAKIQWADQEIKNLAGEIGQFIARNAYATTLNYDPQIGNHRTIIRYTERPRIEWSVVCGNILHQLRSSLDHLACLLSASGDCDRTEFPIYNERGLEVDKPGFCRKIEMFVASAQTIVQGLQPYHRGPLDYSDPLWILRELNNRDKHQSLNPLTVAMEVRNATIVRAIGHGEYERSTFYLSAPRTWHMIDMEAGTDFRLQGLDGGANVHVYAEFPPQVVVSEPAIRVREAVIPLLTKLRDHTARIVSTLSPLIKPASEGNSHEIPRPPSSG